MIWKVHILAVEWAIAIGIIPVIPVFAAYLFDGGDRICFDDGSIIWAGVSHG